MKIGVQAITASVVYNYMEDRCGNTVLLLLIG